jgi:predicted Mrr-cat superfamily restriction endonuclease
MMRRSNGAEAFVLRISPNGIDRVPEALASNQIIIGWSEANGLLDPNLTWNDFRKILADAYYSTETSLRKAGSAAGHMWRFINEMGKGDLVVVPYGSGFYIAEVDGPALCDETKVTEDTAYRRNVIWRNQKQPIPRALARSALISRMKMQGTCAYATDLAEQIMECLHVADSGHKPTFKGDLQARLVRETLQELRDGRMENFGFERLIEEVLRGLGAVETRVVPRSQDKGADIVATFVVAGAIRQAVAVQAKHWQPKPPVGADVVEQLIKGIEAESADLGMVVTSGTIAEEAVKAAEKYYEEKGIRIELLNGEDFAKLIVESGIRAS